ncbi:MAG: polysaccharide pyruvyl transferase family protein [Deltaproteobacteria bacterium]|nr:polysaccharide pyruvyl transferase family protein [Deltaproteobacteria bacterium]MBW2024937.1 polysaccharide pyruvyl transferase family protein [Deltaproteobacteria bacterium]MBW2124966.1 polysaccharide pyruvyl transferase family protein [Deltaproteobacteria bacterium]
MIESEEKFLIGEKYKGQSMLNRMKKYGRFFLDYVNICGPKIGYIGGVYGTGNLGDEALRQSAAALFPQCTLLEFPRKKNLAKLAKLIFPVSNGLLSGGTLINQRALWLELTSIYMSAIRNFIVFGTGVGHPCFWPDRRKEWAGLLNQCRFVGVRGPLSAELLRDAGVKSVEVVGDPVLVFASDDFRTASQGYRHKLLGMNVGWDRWKQWGTEEKIYARAVKLASYAREAGWKVRWFIVSPADVEITIEIASASGTLDEICRIYTDAVRYIDLVKSCSVFVGTRLHSVVLATCSYVPSLALEYRPKCRDYMLSIDQGDFLIRTDMFDAGEAWNRILEIHDNREYFSKALYSSMKPLRELQIRKAQRLGDSILM